MRIRDRIRELRRVKARDLKPSPHNWREHPEAQRDALRGVLAEIGYAGACLARELDDGSLELIDGHLRAEETPDQEVPVLVVDLDEEEAATLIATLDPIGAMAETNAKWLHELLEGHQVQDDRLQGFLDNMAQECLRELVVECRQAAPDARMDRPTELQRHWKIAAGQVWEIHISGVDIRRGIEPKQIAVILQRLKDLGLEPRLADAKPIPRRARKAKSAPKRKRAKTATKKAKS